MKFLTNSSLKARKFYRMSIKDLSDHEIVFINLWGELYKGRGQKERLGKIFGLLTLKADKPENGLDQVEISKLLSCSIRTVSRHLDTLCEMKIVSYLDNKVRKYYVLDNFREIFKRRFYASALEYQKAIKDLSDIKSGMNSKDLEENQNLVQNIDLTQNVLEKISEIFLNVLTEKQ